MKLTPKRWAKALALPIAGLMLVSACSTDESSDDGDDGGSSGTVDVSGSSTVAPISTRVAELWDETGDSATVNVDG